MNGLAFVYLRHDGAPHPLPGGAFGHVGWGLKLDEGRFFFGATENPSGWPVVLPGGDNGFWSGEGTDAAMHTAMRERAYDCFKVIAVRGANPLAGRAKGFETKGFGYRISGSNCADHVWWVMEAYGVIGLPLLQQFLTPNTWFAALNGELHNL